MSYGKTMEAIIKDKELKAYEKGVRDMWEAMKLRCDENFFNEENDTTECRELIFEVAENGCEHLECTFKTCPIAQKLLKGVK